ncbi:serine hydrolase [Williamsia sp. MIQD14]|uniref:serine hydrolase n=1 Tax=Williamsia sp. MIQD14 TaxID=3425703 RepID=UPI003DA184E5
MPRRAGSFLTGLLMAVAALVVPASVGPAAAAPCAPPPAADTSTARGWVGYLAAHPNDYGLLVTDRGRVTVSHRPDRTLPAASAAKIITLAAYGRAVATGAVDPKRTVSVNEWERWYLPIDGGAHVSALKYLGLPALQNFPGARPETQRVSLAQLADVMVRFSDSAASDALRAALGDARLAAVMARYGMTGPPPQYAGLYLSLLDPTSRGQFRVQAAGRRYHDDAAYRTAMFTLATRGVSASDSQIDATYSLTTRSLNTLIGSIATGAFGPGSEQARAVLEFQGAAADGSMVGFKGGSLAASTDSVLVENFERRTASGAITTATLMVRGLSRSDFDRSNYAQQELMLSAMTDPDAAAALRCAAGGH